MFAVRVRYFYQLVIPDDCPKNKRFCILQIWRIRGIPRFLVWMFLWVYCIGLVENQSKKISVLFEKSEKEKIFQRSPHKTDHQQSTKPWSMLQWYSSRLKLEIDFYSLEIFKNSFPKEFGVNFFLLKSMGPYKISIHGVPSCFIHVWVCFLCRNLPVIEVHFLQW